jgi:cell division topological specificity factor
VKRFIDKISGKQTSANTAKERLQLVLIHDRTDLPPGVMESMRDEIIDVISRHVDVEREDVQLKIQQDGRQQFLLAEIPIQSSKRKRGR